MLIRLESSVIRPFRREDADSLARHANNRKIWLNLRDRFPHPFTPEVARASIEETLGMERPGRYAIEVAGEAVGGIGYTLHDDVERVSAEIGYWLGETFWGRGIMTEAVGAFTEWVAAEHALTRVYALPYAENSASAKVLERAGFTLEARMRRSAIKEGRVLDQLLYARIFDPPPGREPGTPHGD